jgi:hypothetical protein
MAIVLVGLVALAAVTPAGADTRTFLGAGGDCECQGFWDVASNWTGTQVPDGDDTAVIPVGKQAWIRPGYSISPVGAVIVEEDPEECQYGHCYQTEIFLLREGGVSTSLTITGYATSRVDGQIRLENECVLQITGNTSIYGAGEINLGTGSVIRDNGNGYTLRLFDNGLCEGTLDRACAPQIISWTGGVVELELDNDAFVVATRGVINPCDDPPESATLRLSTNAKYGDGFWVAEAGGAMEVDVPVSGAGTWLVDDATCSGSSFWIDSCCNDLWGAVVLTRGFLHVRSTGYFCTRGPVYGGGTSVGNGGYLIVDEGRTAKFGGVTCDDCP